MNRWLDLAWKLSFDSCHERQPMAAVVVRGGAVLALASNHQKFGSHAERRALSACNDAKGATVYVMRWNKRISKPCAKCRDLLIKRGVERAIYINLDGAVEEERYA